MTLRNSTTCWLLELLCALVLPIAAAAEPGAMDDSPLAHISVDEDRFGRAARAPNPPSRVTARSYLDTISRFHARFAEQKLYWLDRPDPYPNLSANITVALYFAFRYRVDGEALDAERAVKFIDHAHRVSRTQEAGEPASTLIMIHRIWRWLEKSPAFDDAVKQELRDIILIDRDRFPTERVAYGNRNRAFGFAVDGQVLLRYVPEANQRELWQEYVDEVWAEFWRAGDIRENSSHYEALSLGYLIEWAEIRGASAELYTNPEFLGLLERYMLQVQPIGSLPHYGDANGWNATWGFWIHAFELAASSSRDGRFRWAAHRIFVYALLHIEDIFSWNETGNIAIQSLMRAALVADDSISDVALAADLSVGWRAGIEPAPAGAAENRGPFRVVPELRIPAKLQMRSDASPDATALQLELVPAAGHGPPVPTNLVALTDRGSVLLMDQGYMERERQFHNVLLLDDYDGIPLHPDRESVELLGATDSGPMIYACVRVSNYQGYPVDLERAVVFAKVGAILVVDTLRFRETLRVRTGPLFNLGTLGPEAGAGQGPGETWVNGYLGDFVAVKGIGPGKPVYTRWKNPARDLLLYFRPMEDAAIHVHDRRPRDATTPLPLRLQYRWRGKVEAGQSLSMSSVLLPHTPTRVPRALASRISFAANTGSSSAVSVPTEGDGRVWLVAGPVETAAIRSDARATVVVFEGGAPIAAGAAGGSRLEIDGSVVSGVVRGDPKVGATPAPRPSPAAR